MKIHANATKGSRTERARVNGTEKKIRRAEIFSLVKKRSFVAAVPRDGAKLPFFQKT